MAQLEQEKILDRKDLESDEFDQPQQDGAFLKIVSGDAPVIVVLKSAKQGVGKIGKDANGNDKTGLKLIVETDKGTISTASKWFRFALKPFLAELLDGEFPKVAITAKGENFKKKYYVVKV